MSVVSYSKNGKEMYVRCTHCGDEIYWNTHKKLIKCRCKATYVDGCEDYVRVGGNQGDYEIIHKQSSKSTA